MPARRNDNDPLRRHLSVRERGPHSWQWMYRRNGRTEEQGREATEDGAWKAGQDCKERRERKPYLAAEAENKFTFGALLDQYFRQVEATEIKQMARGENLKTSTMYVYGNVELGKRYKQRGFVLNRCKKLAPWLFDKNLAHVGPEDIEEFTAKRLQDGVSKDTIAKERQALAYVWKHGRKFERLPVKKIFTGFKLPKWRGRKRRILKAAWEYLALYKAISTLPRRKSRRLWTMFAYTMLQTAMREEELTQSLWKNFDIEAKTIFIPMEINKSDRDRTIPMTGKLAMRLGVYCLGLSDKQRLPDERVFSINIDNLRKQWRRTTQIAGLRGAKGRKPRENLELYALKHTAITNFEGEPIGLVGYELDHMADHDSGTNSPQTRGYVNNQDELLNRIRKKLESVSDDPEDMSWDCYAVEDFAFARAFPESAFEWSFPDRHSEGSEWPDIEFIKQNGRVVLDPDKPSTKAYLLKQAEREALALLADYGSDDRNAKVRSEYAIVLRRTRHGYEPVGEHGRMTAGYLPLEEIPEATACSPLSLVILDKEYNGVLRHQDYMIMSEERIKSFIPTCKDVSALIQQVKDSGKLDWFVEKLMDEPTGEPIIL